MADAVVAAWAPWNDTAIDLAAGGRYRMHANGIWFDRQFKATPAGIAPQNFVQRIAVPLLRFANGRYMTLIGCIDKNMDSAFVIGDNVEITAPTSGRLWCFANDVRLAYGNNSGSINLRVERLTP